MIVPEVLSVEWVSVFGKFGARDLEIQMDSRSRSEGGQRYKDGSPITTVGDDGGSEDG